MDGQNLRQSTFRLHINYFNLVIASHLFASVYQLEHSRNNEALNEAMIISIHMIRGPVSDLLGNLYTAVSS